MRLGTWQRRFCWFPMVRCTHYLFRRSCTANRGFDADPGPTYLIHRATLHHALSLSLYVEELGDRVDKEVFDRFVIFADPLLHEWQHEYAMTTRLPRLPGARVEVSAFEKVFGDRASIFVGDTATEAQFKKSGWEGAGAAHSGPRATRRAIAG